MYRTGDIVERVDGKLYFRGRVDNQIKHMGYRIELEEIETALVKLNGVKQCAVVHTVSKNKFSRLTAYIATDEEMDVSEIRNELRKYLPNYMIPNDFVFMDELPKNANGKVDRKILEKGEK
jgi:D-alanine--poly(phosphoribitol) ligase subunit 1